MGILNLILTSDRHEITITIGKSRLAYAVLGGKMDYLEYLGNYFLHHLVGGGVAIVLVNMFLDMLGEGYGEV